MFWNLATRWKSQRYPLVHLLMLAVLALYTLLGAICFCAFEAGHERAKLARWAEEKEQRKVLARNRLVSDMQFFLFREVNVSRLLSADFQRTLDLYDTVMGVHSAARPEGKRSRDGLEPKWTLWGGLYFAGTIYTTIGYGDIVTETVGGKCFTVLYALLSIPLVITVLNVWGGGLFQLVQMLWRNHLLRLMRALPVLGEKRVRPADAKGKTTQRQMENGGDSLLFGGGKMSVISCGTVSAASDLGTASRPRLPLKLALVLLLAWVLTCAAVFALFQHWTFFDAAYFFFISLTTIGLGDYTAEHRVACAYFLLILIGLSVVSMSLNIIQLQIEGIFAKILRSIDADFKSNLIAERRKQSISTSIGIHSLQSQHSTAIQPLASATEVQRKMGQKKVPTGEEETSDALRKYRGSMTKSERLMAQLLMSQHQRKLLDEKLGARRRMKNSTSQTDTEQLVSVQVQTEQLNGLRPFGSLFGHGHHSVDVGGEEDEDESADEAVAEKQNMPAGNHYRRANTFSGGTSSTGTGDIRRKQQQFKHGLGRKRLYIYNTGD